MSFIVRRVGGGTFNPNAMCVSHNRRHLFIGCGTLINIYSIPDLQLLDQCSAHKSRVTALVCSNEFLVSGDADGNILFHRLNNMMCVIEKVVAESFKHEEPIEKLLIRNSVLFYIYYKQRMFWVSEYANNTNSTFIVNQQLQQQLCDIHDSLKHKEPTWLRFPSLDNFDIDPTANRIVIADECKLHVYDFTEKQRTDINLYSPARICRFRNTDNVIVFTQNGKFHQFGESPCQDHWHFVCPNTVVFDRSNVYSGGAEGVFLSYNPMIDKHSYLPRIGMTIEGMVMTDDSQYVCAVVDKNMLVCIDPKNSPLLKASLSHLYGNISFNGNIITSLRKPNLAQFFNSKTGECIDQLSVSSFNCRVPVTLFALAKDYFITVETADGKPTTDLAMAMQSEFNHTKPHGDIDSANEIYQNMLTRRRFEEYRSMMKMRYGTEVPKSEESLIDLDLKSQAIEGNPLVHDKESASCVGYSEVKIWHHEGNEFQLEQSFRIIGKVVSPIAMHPVLPVYSMVVSKELQLWRQNNDKKWQLWKKQRLGSVPESLVWSPDGSIIVLHYQTSIELFDVESFTTLTTKMFDSAIVGCSFLNDSEIIVHSKDSISTFDLRKLAVTKRIFAQAACCAASDDCIALVTNKNKPYIVLSADGEMRYWQLPTTSHVRALNVLRDKTGISITAVDEDNFIWYIDQYGISESKEKRVTAITPVKPKEVKTLPKIDIREDRTRQILELVDVPSHQVPPIDYLCAALFGLVLEKRADENQVTNIIEMDEETELGEEIPPAKVDPQDAAKLRQFFAC